MTRILLAEDDDDMRRFLVKALERAGYQVSDFDNGASAYERLREEPFSLLLTDIVMPEMDGIELARRATEIDPDLKVMFITGFAAVALNPDSKAPRDAKILSKPRVRLVGHLGVWRSLVARVVRDDEVAGSNPVTPTYVMCRDIVDRCLGASLTGPSFGRGLCHFLGW